MPDKNYRSPWEGVSYKRPSAGAQKKPDRPKGRGLAFALAALAAFAVLIAGAYFYFSSESEGPDIGFQFSQPPRVLAGEPLEFSVSFSNFSDSILKNVRLSLFLPDGVFFLGQPQSQRVVEQAVGDLGPGSVGRQNFELIVSGDSAGSLKRVRVKLAYSTGGVSSAQFESSAEADIVVGEPAVDLKLETPESVFNGQDFEIAVSYKNNTNKEFRSVRLNIDYPPIFEFKRSTMQSEGSGNNSWDLGTLSPGSSGSLTITGTVVGPERSFFSFNSSLSGVFLGSSYKINSKTASLSVAQAPLSLDVVANNSKGYVGLTGDTVNYVLTYRNSSGLSMQNATVRAKLIGEMFDFSTLKADGVFSSLANTISWFGANTPQLLNIAPGQSGSVKFSIRLRDSFPIRLISDKNYAIKIQAEIESPTVPPGTAATKTISLADLENKIAGRIQISAASFWRDAASGFLNQGPYPPKVNQPTQFTVHWWIRNFSTDAEGVKVSAFLQSGARFTGQVKSSIESVPAYNPNSGLMTWDVGFVPATKGVISDPVEAVFQVEVVPAVTQIGRTLPLVGEIKLEGRDAFTGLRLADTARAVSTDVPNDATITAKDRGVQP